MICHCLVVRRCVTMSLARDVAYAIHFVKQIVVASSQRDRLLLYSWWTRSYYGDIVSTLLWACVFQTFCDNCWQTKAWILLPAGAVEVRWFAQEVVDRTPNLSIEWRTHKYRMHSPVTLYQRNHTWFLRQLVCNLSRNQPTGSAYFAMIQTCTHLH